MEMQWMTTPGQDQSGAVAVAGGGGQNAAVEKLSGLLQHLGSSGGALLEQLQRESWATAETATARLPRGLWVLGLLGALIVVFALAAVALHFFRCACSGPSCKAERKQSLLP